jgi:hypothetical protein
MKLGFARLEIDVAERLQAVQFKLRKSYEYAAVAAESLEVGEALLVEINVEPLDLEIGHITDTLAQRAFVVSGPSELEPLNQAPLRQR